MARVSAGLLLYKRSAESLRVLLVHPGGPLWRHRDEDAWAVPKGLAEVGRALCRPRDATKADIMANRLRGLGSWRNRQTLRT